MATRPFKPVDLSGGTGTIADTVEPFPELSPAPTTAGGGFAPDPELGQLFSASRTLSRPYRTDFDQVMLRDGYAPILDALELGRSQNPANFARGFGPPSLDGSTAPLPAPRYSSLLRDQGKSWLSSFTYQEAQERLIVEAIRRRRQADPRFLAGVPDTVEGLRGYILEQEKARRGEAASVAARGSGVGATLVGLAGGVAGTYDDPLNLATIAVGGGPTRSVLIAAGREGLINGALETFMLPSTKRNLETLGEELTVGEAVTDVALATLGGTVLGAGQHGAARLARPIEAAAAKAYDRTVEAVFEAMPESVQKRWAGKMKAGGVDLNDLFGDVDNKELADFAEATIGGDKMTPDEAAALTVLRREQDVGDSSPFEGGPDGDAAHQERLGDAIRAILDAPHPRASAATSAGTLASSTALTPPAQPFAASSAGGRSQFEGRVRGAESGGDDAARNRRSSAAGRYQFTDDTWSRYHQRIYGGDGLADKFDPAKQERLFAALTDDNERALQAFGIPLSAGNYYLAHFAGAGGAAKLHRAPPGASAVSVLGRKVVDANPFLAKMTARDVIEWAHGKMGEEGVSTTFAAVAGIDVDGAEAAIAAARVAADQAEREGLDLAEASARDLTAGRTPAPEIEPVPVLRRELFASDEDWVEAQIAVRTAVEGPAARETVAEAPEVAPGVENRAPGASFAPLVYHGTNRAFDQFERRPGMRRGEYGEAFEVEPQAFFFSEDADTAAMFARDRSRIDAEIRAAEPGEPRVGAYRLRVDQPLDLVIDGAALRQIRERGFDNWMNMSAPNPLVAEDLGLLTGNLGGPETWTDVQRMLDDPNVVAALKAEGYDAVRLREDDGSVSWAVFDPEQIVAAELAAGSEVRLNDPSLAGFDTPGSPGRQAQVESLEHDLRLDLEAARTATAEAAAAILARQQRDGKLPRSPRSLIGFIRAAGGIEDRGGDLKSRGVARIKSKARKGETKLIRPHADAGGLFGPPLGQQHANSPDELALRAWEAGYFPEFAERPAVDDLLEAIDAELRGVPRYAIDDQEAVFARARAEEERAWTEQQLDEIEELAGEWGVAVDEGSLEHALTAIGRGEDPAAALAEAVEAAAMRDLAQAVADTGETRYMVDDSGRRWDEEVNHARHRETAADDPAPDRGGGRSAGERADAAPGRPLAEQSEGAAGESRPLEEAAAPPERLYRLTEDGDERPLGEILAELDAERDAIAALRECLK